MTCIAIVAAAAAAASAALQICSVADRVGVGVYFNTLVPVEDQVR
jgi:hypothetical protein